MEQKCFFSFVIILIRGVHELLIVSFARQRFLPLPDRLARGVQPLLYTENQPKPTKMDNKGTTLFFPESSECH